MMQQDGLKRDEDLFWTGRLVRILRGKRSLSEFGALIGAPKNTVWRWEAGMTTPHPRYAQRLGKLSQKEGFLADWELAGSMTITGSIESGSQRIGEAVKQSVRRTARQLT